MELSEGGKWDNCNSIINKYIKKKRLDISKSLVELLAPVGRKNYTKNTLKKDFIYLFLERGDGKDRGRRTSMCGCLLCAPYWGLCLQPRPVP